MSGLSADKKLTLLRDGRPPTLGARHILAVEEHQRCGTRQVLAAARMSTFAAAGLNERDTMSSIAADRGLRFEQAVLSPTRRWGDVAGHIERLYGVDLRRVKPESFKPGTSSDDIGLRQRAEMLKILIDSMVAGQLPRPKAVVHAVIEIRYGYSTALLEPDLLIVTPDRIIVGEIKSWMTVDGQMPAMQAAHAAGQAGLYLIGLEDHLLSQGHRPEQWLDPVPFLVAPRNYTVTPTVVRLADAPRRAVMARSRLRSLPGRLDGLLADVDPATVNDPDVMITEFGHHYSPAVCVSCGFRDVCRSRIAGKDGLELLGFTLPGVDTVSRAIDLAAGTPPTRTERSVAGLLQRARATLDMFGALPPAPVQMSLPDTVES